jgi:hypothetical protein
MMERILAARAAVLVRISGLFTISKGRRMSSGLALTCLLLTVCAAAAGNSREENSPPKTDPAAAPAARLGAAAPVVADPTVLQRRREAIAQMLEKNMAYRGILDDGVPRLVEVKLGGPF